MPNTDSALPLEQQLRALVAGKAMPLGALGRIEDLAIQIGRVRGTLAPPPPRAIALVLAGDHGLAIEDAISAYPAAITHAIAGLVAAGKAGINVCASAAGIAQVTVVDCGLSTPLTADPPRVLDRRIGAGTASALRGPAMTERDLDRALAIGAELAATSAADGFDTLCLGEIGIGNTSAAALLGHALTGIPLATLIGPGAGQTAEGLQRKHRLLREAAARGDAQHAHGPRAALAAYAGFEMAVMAGVMIAAPTHRQLVLVDGFIATAVACAALSLAPALRPHLVFAHHSAEPGHRALLQHLDVEPLLALSMRLGEGTGAALAYPLVKAATALLTDLADLPGPRPV